MMAEPRAMPQPLQFLPLQTSISPSFWHRLTDLKLHHLQLSDAPVPIVGHYGRGKQITDRVTGQAVGISAGLELDSASFDDAQAHQAGNVGQQDQGQVWPLIPFRHLPAQIWARATSTSPNDPPPTLESLNPFLLITFADLKKYRYYYWCAFPAVVQKPGWEVVDGWSSIDRPELPLDSVSLGRTEDFTEQAPLSEVSTFWSNIDPQQRTVIVSDPSSHPSAPGWPVRNLLLFLSRTPLLASSPCATLRLILVRDNETITAQLRLKSAVESEEIDASQQRPATVGWEKNEKGKLGPRMADLGPLMDPTRLADQAVDLNLQLMRWRIMPSLDLDKVKHTKCLLLGAGTLGCYVARTLMAWGVRKITLVDSSTVSYSNPVRQPLFEFADSLNGGKPKAEAAAAALKRIYPGVDARGIALSVPMPGHPISPSAREQTKKDLEQLEALIAEHDVVYLLMDSRESRWLPTVIGAAKGKLVMNVALGFDTYLVMRHGLPSSSSSEKVDSAQVKPGSIYRGQLGCYYCNDVVAPMDSLSDRTLDQMCTVTRPGIASIASSTAVELMVSILQHPKGPHAPSIIPGPGTASASREPAEIEEAGSPLGIVPHQIRGFLGNFDALKITGQAYDRCTGCSEAIIGAYRTDPFALVESACDDAKYLERLTGLDKLEEETEKMLAEGVSDWEEDGEGEDDF
ncbi:Autophagy protein 7 [Rhodotorula mucilaginosa]|uniref:Ubiquitin-like modifier-activating enzyme ATG7 n=1 Tax=Rhodotorula mucilaginosa TaxID=5537 RepID=A0A9P6VVA6_RHOMI|nr:Autophagy protein 7 [Rhodotorula mucilaginosa]